MRRFLLSAVLAVGLVSMAASSFAAAGARMFVQHKVTDVAAWRKGYDAFDATRRKLGVIHQEVWVVDGEPNNVIVIHDFASMEKAKAFAGSPELKAAMEKAGVDGAPTIWFATKSGK